MRILLGTSRCRTEPVLGQQDRSKDRLRPGYDGYGRVLGRSRNPPLVNNSREELRKSLEQNSSNLPLYQCMVTFDARTTFAHITNLFPCRMSRHGNVCPVNFVLWANEFVCAPKRCHMFARRKILFEEVFVRGRLIYCIRCRPTLEHRLHTCRPNQVV